MSARTLRQILPAEVDHLYSAEDKSREARRLISGRRLDLAPAAQFAAETLIDEAIAHLVGARAAIKSAALAPAIAADSQVAS